MRVRVREIVVPWRFSQRVRLWLIRESVDFDEEESGSTVTFRVDTERVPYFWCHGHEETALARGILEVTSDEFEMGGSYPYAGRGMATQFCNSA